MDKYNAISDGNSEREKVFNDYKRLSGKVDSLKGIVQNPMVITESDIAQMNKSTDEAIDELNRLRKQVLFIQSTEKIVREHE